VGISNWQQVCFGADLIPELSLKNYDSKKEHQEKRSTAMGSDKLTKPVTYRKIQE
jgi:hypothetical protein